MATKKQGQVTLRGRFRPGTDVRLVKVAGEHVLRAEGGDEVGTATVDDSGCVQFKSGVEVGARYFIVGQIAGTPTEVRVRGNAAGEESAVLTTAPVGYDRTKHADGSWTDEEPEQADTPKGEVAPALGQHQVRDDVVQRSATPRGYATPVDTSETAPYPSQQDEPFTTGKVLQRSDTEFGMATPIPVTPPVRQEDADDGKLLQRSDTPAGVTTPIPTGSAVEIERAKAAAGTKAKVGEPVKAASRLAGAAKKLTGRKAAGKKSAARKTAASSSRKSNPTSKKR